MAIETATGSAEPAGDRQKRRRLPIVPMLVLIGIVAGFAYLYVFRSRPSQQVRRVIDAQIKLATGGRFDDLWQDTLSLSVKKACPEDAFRGAMDQLRASQPDFWNLIEYRDLHIQVQGDRAIVTYVITFNGTPIEAATLEEPDIYTRATETVYGATLTKSEQLRRLESLRDQALVVGKEYEETKRDIERHGDIRLVDSAKGRWYDDMDSHVRCQS